jgi:hypothetical protein
MIQQRIIDRLTTQWNLLKEGEEIPDFSKLNIFYCSTHTVIL